MKHLLRRAAPVITAAFLLLPGCASSPPQPKPEAMLAAMDQTLRAAQAPGTIQLHIVSPEVRTGQAVTIEVATTTSGYLYLYQIGTEGTSLTMLFPNASDGANYIGSAVALPRPNWRIVAKGPAGIGYLIAVVAEQPQDLMAQAAQVAAGRIQVTGRYAAAMAPLRELP